MRRTWLPYEDAQVLALRRPRPELGSVKLLAERLGRSPASVSARLKLLRDGTRFPSNCYHIGGADKRFHGPALTRLARPEWFEENDLARRLVAGR